MLLSTGRDPWEDLTYGLCGSRSLGDGDNHRGKQSNKIASPLSVELNSF